MIWPAAALKRGRRLGTDVNMGLPERWPETLFGKGVSATPRLGDTPSTLRAYFCARFATGSTAADFSDGPRDENPVNAVSLATVCKTRPVGPDVRARLRLT